MLRSVIDDYLTSTKELQFFLPFLQLLELRGYHDIHLVHGTTEFGKDFIAKMREPGGEVQYSFQIKVGDVNLSRFRTEIKPQLLEAVTNRLSHPNLDRSLPYRVVLVTTGVIHPTATIEFQEFNRFVEEKLNATPIVTWEKPKLTADFLNIGIEPFFDLHRAPELAGRFFRFYSQITNEEPLSFFDIETYSKYWLEFDWSNAVNRFQVFFESYFFSKLLLDKGRHYESTLVLASLVRVLIRSGAYSDYRRTIQEYLDEILISHFGKARTKYKTTQPYLLDHEGVFAIFYHPLSCLRTLELLSLYILTSPSTNKDLESFFLRMLDEQKGCYRIISDNYAVSIVFVTLALLRLSETDRLRKFLNNVCVWLCDRRAEVGIAALGSSLRQEIEQLLSENLEGLSNQNNAGGFAACACLDMAHLLGDKKVVEDIANDFRASETILEFCHVLNDDALFIHDHDTIVTSTDSEFALDCREDYSQIISYERKANSISFREKYLLMLVFLLRDRYFPTFIADIMK
jgi:hypothetical protein